MKQSSAVHIPASYSADVILLVISSKLQILVINLASVPGRQLVNSTTAAILERWAQFFNNSMLLFKVQKTFMVTGLGLILVPDFCDKTVGVNDIIKIIRPDNTIIETLVKGISFNNNRDILVGSELTKDNVPINSEVWLLNKKQ